MTIRLTRQQVVDLRPCSLTKIPVFKSRRSMSAEQALDAGVSIGDLLWVASRLGRRDLCVKFALACAERVKRLNTDPRVQAALDAAQSWLDTSNAPAAAANAAYAATNAANAAYAANATNATNAAYAASKAAASATYAAYTAYTAANAAAYAANAAGSQAKIREQEEQRRIFIEIFS